MPIYFEIWEDCLSQQQLLNLLATESRCLKYFTNIFDLDSLWVNMTYTTMA